VKKSFVGSLGFTVVRGKGGLFWDGVPGKRSVWEKLLQHLEDTGNCDKIYPKFGSGCDRLVMDMGMNNHEGFVRILNLSKAYMEGRQTREVLRLSRPWAVVIIPDVQQPHWVACFSIKAS